MTQHTAVPLDKERLRATIADVLDVDVADVTDTASFVEDLEVDSLMALEVMVVLEQQYSVQLAEDEIKDISCLQSAYDLLDRKLGHAP